MPEVKVTILMPAWNASAYIGEAIDSALAQTFTDFELLIVNDGSTDDTLKIIQQYSDPRIRVIQQANQGIAMALNNGLQEAKGIYIARFDADDICLPGRLQKQAGFLDLHPDYILTGSDAEYIDANHEHLFDFRCIGHEHDEIMQQLYAYCPFIHSSVMYRKQAVLESGGYSPYAHNFEDYLLWVRLAKYGRYSNLPEQLIKVRFNPGSATIDEKWRGRRFRRLKRKIIQQGFITQDEGDQLLSIIKKQDRDTIKAGAYYALCGKKFLVDNHQPARARMHFAKAISSYPFKLDNYAFYILSFFPQTFINWLHRRKPNTI